MSIPKRKKTEILKENRYTVSWQTIIRATSESQAKAKALRSLKRQGIASLVVCQIEDIKDKEDTDSHCKHGKLWSAYCDYC